MKSKVIVFWFVVLATSVTASAQSPIGPPGFTPGQGDDSVSSVPAPPRIYSGQTDLSDSFPNPTLDQTYGPLRYPSANPDRIRTFRQPAVPSAVLDSEPAMPRIWFRTEALLWWSKSSPLPIPVVTQGNPSDAIPGALGQPGTSVLIGNQNIDLPVRGGTRLTFGFTFDPAQTWGVEASYFSLATTTVSQGVVSDGSAGSALLAFPFYDASTQAENASPIALPGSFAGAAVTTLQTFLQGVDLNLMHNISNSGGVRFDLLGGFRYLNLQEDLSFQTDSPNVYPNYPGFFRTFDQFNTTSNFYGGQLGARASYDLDRFFVNATGKLAIGATSENVSVNGGTYTNIGGYASAPGAYLSQPTNMGSQSRDQFAVVPEMNLNLGFRLRPWASIIVGYSFLYISSVARPGDQIDRVVNPTQSPAITGVFPGSLSGPARPDLTVHSTDFWAQGLNFAFELRF